MPDSQPEPEPAIVGEHDPIVWVPVLERLDTVMREGLTKLGYM